MFLFNLISSVVFPLLVLKGCRLLFEAGYGEDIVRADSFVYASLGKLFAWMRDWFRSFRADLAADVTNLEDEMYTYNPYSDGVQPPLSHYGDVFEDLD